MFKIKNLTKSYWTPRGRRYVFRDLSLELPVDKNIGLIGRNGAGKSTLMRLLSGVDAPDSGVVLTDKSISWPVGQSGGFQGSMTGRENVQFVCRLHGYHGERMRRVIEYVRDFSEIGEWFEQPVKAYSSGMRSRIAFGLSMAFDFDYYLIDEVMAAGDAQFRAKCQAVFKEKLVAARILLTTHNMKEVEKLCDVVMLVANGSITLYEDVAEGIAAYKK